MSNQFRRNQKELLKEECLRYCGGKICVTCGDISGFPCCYEFHHKIGAKEEDISKMIARKTKLDAELKAELDKCSVVCVTCHRMITNKVMPLELLKKLYNPAFCVNYLFPPLETEMIYQKSEVCSGEMAMWGWVLVGYG